MPKDLPQTRTCPVHKEFWPDEDEMRPIEEFRITKDGHIQPTYCRRCTSKRATAYRKTKDSGEAATAREPSEMKKFLSVLRDEVLTLAAQIELGDEAEIARLSEEFGTYAEQQARDILAYHATQHQRLESVEKVTDQRRTELP
jgi:hypothetical protein